MSKLIDANDRLLQLTNKAIGIDKLIQLLTDGGAVAAETIYTHKSTRLSGTQVTTATGNLTDVFVRDGTPVGTGLVPAASGTFFPTNVSQGALGQADATGGRSKYLASLAAYANQGGFLLLYDRLAHCSGFSGTSTAVQNANGGASVDATRYTDGVGNWLCWQVYSAVGATATSMTATYTDGAGAVQTTPAIQIGGTNRGTALSGVMYPIPLTAGGATIKGFTSAQAVASTGTVGDWGLTLIHPLMLIPIAAAGCAHVGNFLNADMPIIQPGACLSFMSAVTGTNMMCIDTFATFVEV